MVPASVHEDTRYGMRMNELLVSGLEEAQIRSLWGTESDNERLVQRKSIVGMTGSSQWLRTS